MFKKIKEINELLRSLHLMHSLTQDVAHIREKVDDMSSKPEVDDKLPILEFKRAELLDIEKAYYDRIKDDIDHRLKSEGYDISIDRCITRYDTLLYYADKDIGSSDIMKISTTIIELKLLRSYILRILFGTDDIFSFYLYFTDTVELNGLVSELPHIDLDKVFMIDMDNIKTNLDGDIETGIDVSKYVAVLMTKHRLTILSPDKSYGINPKFKKTVLRVLYSIYTEKYYLYHLK